MLREEFAKNPGKKVEPNKAVALAVVGITGSPQTETPQFLLATNNKRHNSVVIFRWRGRRHKRRLPPVRHARAQEGVPALRPRHRHAGGQRPEGARWRRQRRRLSREEKAAG